MNTRSGGRQRRTPPLLVGLIAAAVLLTLSAVASGAGPGTVTTRTSSLGRILTDAQGHTLYLFEKDTGHRSACYGQCARYWPPALTSGKPRAAAGAKASLLGAARRQNGTMQVTYAGHPLYRYAGDTKPGQVNGEGSKEFGASWYVLTPTGKKIDRD